MNESDKTIKIQKLKGASNYRTWSAEISAHLEGKGLLGVTLGNEPRPDGLDTPQSSTQPVDNPRNRRDGKQTSAARPSSSPGVERGSLDEGPLEKWRRKDDKSRSLIMTHCQTHMKDKIVHLQTAKEMWETLKTYCRPPSNVSLATCVNCFYSYEPKRDATVDSISNELQDLQSAIFMIKEDEKPTELSKISALLRAVRKLDPEFNTRIEILEDKLDTLDYEATVVVLKETESRIKASRSKVSSGYEEGERSLATNNRKARGKGRTTQQGPPKGQKRKWTGCYTCSGNHYQRDCVEWLSTPEGREYKRQKNQSGERPSASTRLLPAQGVTRLQLQARPQARPQSHSQTRPQAR